MYVFVNAVFATVYRINDPALFATFNTNFSQYLANRSLTVFSVFNEENIVGNYSIVLIYEGLYY